MKCTLMNKNTEVMLTEYDSATGVFTKVYDVYNINYAPYILKSFYTSEDINDTPFRTNLSEWSISIKLKKDEPKYKFINTAINPNYSRTIRVIFSLFFLYNILNIAII